MTLSRPLEVLAARRALGHLTAGSDVVHTHAVSTLLPYALARPRQPWLHTEHWSGVTDRGATLSTGKRIGAQWMLHLEKLPDVVTAVSEQLAYDLRGFRPRGEMLTVPNEVSIPTVPEPRRAVMLGRDTLQLVGIGGLIPRKRPDLAVRIVAALADRGIPARLTWAGDGPLAEQCTLLAKDLGVEITLLGQVPSDDIWELFARSDIFLVPTLAETFFLAAAEAIAAGRPVVTSNRGAHARFLDPSVAALVDQKDPSRWAQEIIDLMERCQSLSAQDIQDTLPQAFTPHRVAQAYENAYSATIHAFRS